MKTLREIITNFMEKKADGVATLKQIYEAIDESDYESASETVHDSARAVIYRNPGTFKRVCKGIYMLKGEKSTSLLINGDGRKMEEIEDASVDCIITDHPWEDKKAHRSGNQKCFADYETFRYEVSDFKEKARVLKDGAYLVEFLPVESATNYEYLYEIKQMADKCGLEYYTHCIWRNAPEGTINTGKTTKGVQQLIIFSKGKPRKLSKASVNAYQTREILRYEIEMLLPTKEKHHQAEKPVALYEYLIEQLTEEEDVCLDQFGGSCNMMKAAINKNRFAIVYELAEDFVKKAAERFGCSVLYQEAQEAVSEVKEAVEVVKETVAKEFVEFKGLMAAIKSGMIQGEERKLAVQRVWEFYEKMKLTVPNKPTMEYCFREIFTDNNYRKAGIAKEAILLADEARQKEAYEKILMTA